MASQEQGAPSLPKGPLSWTNWRSASEGLPETSFEVPLFTDARITGQVVEGLGPYKVLNAIPALAAAPTVPSLYLRVDWFLDESEVSPDLNTPNSERWHGGSLQEEIAALLGLSMGVRLKAGGITRRFDGPDPKGRPESWEHGMNPVLVRQAGISQPVIPRLGGSHGLEVSLFRQFADLSAHEATTLVRAARLYQDAVWIADAAPDLAWLMLVSALETVAVFVSGDDNDPIDAFRSAQPEIAQKLTDCNEELLALVAKWAASNTGSTRKFLAFVMRHELPEPPDRPLEGFRIALAGKQLRNSMKVIYDHRSIALHTGVPFPAPMCWAPTPGGEHPAERPPTAGTMASSWSAKDMPMNLHSFEWIVRHSLLLWWRSLLSGPTPTTLS